MYVSSEPRFIFKLRYFRIDINPTKHFCIRKKRGHLPTSATRESKTVGQVKGAEKR